MLVKRYITLRMSEHWLWFIGAREPRPCVAWSLFGVIPLFIDQKALSVMP